MAAISVFSAGSLAVTTASAATTSAVQVQGAGSDGFFNGASTLISVISKSHPIAAIISNGLLGAFKTIYRDATSKPEPTNQDIVDLLNQLSEKIDDHYNAQTSQVKALESIEKLQNFANILTSIKGYNERAMGQISLYNDKKVCAQDYENIIECTIGDKQIVTDFMNFSNLVIDGQTGIKGKPSFMQYIDYSKACKENGNDAVSVKKDCEIFSRMTMEQYALFFTNIITGSLAKYNLAEDDYQHGRIDLDRKLSTQQSIKRDMEIFFKKAENVVKKYLEAENVRKNLTAAKVTVNGKTTEMFSFGDAWVTVSKNGGTMQLVKDWKSDDLPGDVYYYNANNEFRNGALFVTGKSVTLDLNGNSIVHTKARNYDIVSENASLTLKDSSGNHAAVSGILASGGSVSVDGATIRESSDAGIRADGLSLNIKNTFFLNNRNSAVVTGSGASTTIDDCLFKTNYESAVFNRDSEVTVQNSRFEDNRSDSGSGTDKNGGAIYSHGKLRVFNCQFVSNKAGNGGAVYTDCMSRIAACSFSDNTVKYNGGAVMSGYRGSDWCEPLTIDGSTFKGNRSGSDGGAVYCDSMNFLFLNNVEITGNTAGSNGGGLYCGKGSGSSCDPNISGRITITNNWLTNGEANNAFLGENTTSKCIFKINDNIDPNSRIGVTSPTGCGSLDICKIFNKDAYENAANVFSYDNGSYRINRYTHWYSNLWWVEIVKN